MIYEFYAKHEHYLDLRREAQLRRLFFQNEQSNRKGNLWMGGEQTSKEGKYSGKSRENPADRNKIS